MKLINQVHTVIIVILLVIISYQYIRLVDKKQKASKYELFNKTLYEKDGNEFNVVNYARAYRKIAD